MTTHTIQTWQQRALEMYRSEYTRVCRVCDSLRQTVSPAGAERCTACSTGFVPLDLTPTFIASRLALIHAAIGRATECVVRGELQVCWAWPGTTIISAQPTDHCIVPFGLPIALAEVFLRLCALAEALGLVLENVSAVVSDHGEPLSWLNDLHKVFAAVPSKPHSNTGADRECYVYDAHEFLVKAAEALRADLPAAAELLWQYQAKRDA